MEMPFMLIKSSDEEHKEEEEEVNVEWINILPECSNSRRFMDIDFWSDVDDVISLL